MKKTLIIFILFYSILNAQGIQLGLRVEPYAYFSEKVRDEKTYSSEYQFSTLPPLYVQASQEIMNDFMINLKTGYLFSKESFDGFEIGSSAQLNNFLINKFYVSSGVNFHFNGESAHGTTTVETSESKVIYFLFLGAGYELSKHISIDISYQQAMNPKYGDTFLSPDLYHISGPKKLHNLIKFGIQFSTG